MGVSHIAVIAAISLSGLLPSSCSKTFFAKEAKKQSPSHNPAVANSNPAGSAPASARDLGELQLTNRYETCVNLGAGRSCIITPNLLGRDNLQLTLALQSKRADGKIAGFIVTQVTTRPGKPFEAVIGDVDITITPEIAKE